MASGMVASTRGQRMTDEQRDRLELEALLAVLVGRVKDLETRIADLESHAVAGAETSPTNTKLRVTFTAVEQLAHAPFQAQGGPEAAAGMPAPAPAATPASGATPPAPAATATPAPASVPRPPEVQAPPPQTVNPPEPPQAPAPDPWRDLPSVQPPTQQWGQPWPWPRPSRRHGRHSRSLRRQPRRQGFPPRLRSRPRPSPGHGCSTRPFRLRQP